LAPGGEAKAHALSEANNEKAQDGQSDQDFQQCEARRPRGRRRTMATSLPPRYADVGYGIMSDVSLALVPVQCT
jgi:hypothetical protein